MNLIHAHHRDIAAVLAEILYEELLWGDEEHLDVLTLDCLHYLALQLEVLVGVQGGTRKEIWQLGELVGHQGNQGGHHED